MLGNHWNLLYFIIFYPFCHNLVVIRFARLSINIDYFRWRLDFPYEYAWSTRILEQNLNTLQEEWNCRWAQAKAEERSIIIGSIWKGEILSSSLPPFSLPPSSQGQKFPQLKDWNPNLILLGEWFSSLYMLFFHFEER